MFSVSSQRPRRGHETPAWLPDVVATLTREFEGEVAADAVEAHVWKAVHAVEFFGDDPDEHVGLVTSIAANQLAILVGRDSDRARS